MAWWGVGEFVHVYFHWAVKLLSLITVMFLKHSPKMGTIFLMIIP